MIHDDYGRPVLNLRIAVTQRCNLRCQYCHLEGETSKLGLEMTVGEIGRITGIAARLGVSKVKLTGGEPMVRDDIVEIIQRLARVEGIVDLAMTTNGTLLAGRARELREAGLNRVNISLPSLSPVRYRNLTGGSLRDLIRGVEAAVEAGLYPVKLNTVVLHAVNQDEIDSLIGFSERTGTILQIIELEPVNIDPEYYSRFHHPLKEIEAGLRKRALRVEARPYMNQRRVYHLPNAKVEVVNPIENTEFCAHCTRLRLTSDGKLKPCLMRNDNLVDILTPLRMGASDEELHRIFVEAVKRREPYHRPVAQARPPA
ncbi:MAG: GTP 3',8-cyclase MoaA [Candidatus Bathyarchaeia archaeon]